MEASSQGAQGAGRQEGPHHSPHLGFLLIYGSLLTEGSKKKTCHSHHLGDFSSFMEAFWKMFLHSPHLGDSCSSMEAFWKNVFS